MVARAIHKPPECPAPRNVSTMTRKLATGLCCLGAVLLTSCATVVESSQGGGGSGGTGGTSGMGGMPGTDCDPVAQTGCNAGEKCSQVVLTADPEPPIETRCVAAGSQGEFDACSYGDPGNAGFDDCEAGLLCFGGVCLGICSADPDSCPTIASCQEGTGIFADRPGTGVCFVDCDPLGQDCPEGASCFVTVIDGDRICAETNPGQDQGATCMFANDCAAGHGCLLIQSEVDSTLTCAFFCDPEGGSPSCAEGPGATFACERIVDFYADVDHLGSDLGFCVDPLVFP